MIEPTNQTPTLELIDHIQIRYHDTHRRELPNLISLARIIETDHATDPNSPHGLTDALEAMSADLETHMRDEEESVFAVFQSGKSSPVGMVITELREAHSHQEAALNRIAAITHGFRLPHHSGHRWRRLYAGLGKLAEDLDEHMYLENELLFPRVTQMGSKPLSI